MTDPIISYQTPGTRHLADVDSFDRFMLRHAARCLAFVTLAHAVILPLFNWLFAVNISADLADFNVAVFVESAVYVLLALWYLALGRWTAHTGTASAVFLFLIACFGLLAGVCLIIVAPFLRAAIPEENFNLLALSYAVMLLVYTPFEGAVAYYAYRVLVFRGARGPGNPLEHHWRSYLASLGNKSPASPPNDSEWSYHFTRTVSLFWIGSLLLTLSVLAYPPNMAGLRAPIPTPPAPATPPPKPALYTPAPSDGDLREPTYGLPRELRESAIAYLKQNLDPRVKLTPSNFNYLDNVLRDPGCPIARTPEELFTITPLPPRTAPSSYHFQVNLTPTTHVDFSGSSIYDGRKSTPRTPRPDYFNAERTVNDARTQIPSLTPAQCSAIGEITLTCPRYYYDPATRIILTAEPDGLLMLTLMQTSDINQRIVGQSTDAMVHYVINAAGDYLPAPNIEAFKKYLAPEEIIAEPPAIATPPVPRTGLWCLLLDSLAQALTAVFLLGISIRAWHTHNNPTAHWLRPALSLWLLATSALGIYGLSATALLSTTSPYNHSLLLCFVAATALTRTALLRTLWQKPNEPKPNFYP